MESPGIPLFLSPFLSRHIIQLMQAKLTICLPSECPGEKQTSEYSQKHSHFRDGCQVLKPLPKCYPKMEWLVSGARHTTSSREGHATSSIIERGTSDPIFRHYKSVLVGFLSRARCYAQHPTKITTMSLMILSLSSPS